MNVEWAKSVNTTATVTHWFLRNEETGKIVDLTADQFDPISADPNHAGGTAAGFLTTDPSERAEQVIEAI